MIGEALVVLLLLAPTAQAHILTYLHEGNGSGTLNGIEFSASDFLITATVDTDTRYSLYNDWVINHTSASISIDGVGNFDFLTGTFTFVSNGLQLAGFSRLTPTGTPGLDLFNGPTGTEFGTWDMLDPIGPISGSGRLLQWDHPGLPAVNTTGGVLVFDSGASDATFTALPEPATLFLLALGGLLVTKRRR